MEIQLIGNPKIKVNGVESFTRMSKRLLGLIFFLAANKEKSVSKSRLCELFWYDMDDESARANLRQALFLIKKHINEEEACDGEELSLIISEVNACKINSEIDVWVDMAEFRKAMENAGTADSLEKKINYYDKALTLCTGIFLDDFYIKGNSAFEEWIILERENQNRLLEQACRSLAAAYQESGDFDHAIFYLKKLLDIDPLLEDVHLQLMKAYCKNKERGKAISQFQQCVKILSKELNIGPMQELRNFYDSIIDDGNAHGQKNLEPSLHEGKTIRISIKHGNFDIEYGDIYEALRFLVEEDELIPSYLKLGLSKIYPEYSPYSIRQIEDEYFAFTVRKLLEELSNEYEVLFEVSDRDKLDEKSKMVTDYLQGCYGKQDNRKNFKLIFHTNYQHGGKNEC
mgnify:CR=1 FL=1